MNNMPFQIIEKNMICLFSVAPPIGPRSIISYCMEREKLDDYYPTKPVKCNHEHTWATSQLIPADEVFKFAQWIGISEYIWYASSGWHVEGDFITTQELYDKFKSEDTDYLFNDDNQYK